MLSLKKSLTEQPARPEEAQAQAQAQLEAQEDAHEECDLRPLPELRPPERRLPEEVLTGTLITFTWIKVLGLLPYL